MAKVEYVRKNILTNNYEHLVTTTMLDGSISSYWSPGMTGLDWLSNTTLVQEEIIHGYIQLPERANDSQYAYMVSYEDYSRNIHGEYESNLIHESYNWLSYIESNDIGIRELQTDKLPIFTYIPENDPVISQWFMDGELKLLLGYQAQLRMESINPVYDLQMKMIYRWTKDGELLTTSPAIIIGDTMSDSGVIQGEVENEAGVSKTSKFNLKVYDPRVTKKFYVNLIKNGNGSDALGGWQIITGAPEAVKIGNWLNQSSDMYYNESYFNRLWLGSHGERIEPFGPFPSAILPGNPAALNAASFYIRGGLAGDLDRNNLDKFVVMKQDIDLSSVSDYIDRKIYGVTDIFGCLFGWLGNMGQAGGFQERYNIVNHTPGVGSSQPTIVPVIQPILAQGQFSDNSLAMSWNSTILTNNGSGWQNMFDGNLMILDRVYVELKLYNENDNEIKSEYIMYSPLHMGEDFKFFLRCQYIYIPYGTRRIEVWVKFQRGNNALYQPFQYYPSDNRSATTFTRWGRWNGDKNEVEQVHSSAFTHLNLHLYVNNTDEYYDKIKNYLSSVYFKQYEMEEDLLNGITQQSLTDSYLTVDNGLDKITNHAKFINNRFKHSNSAIHLKVYDLYHYENVHNFNELFTIIKTNAWYADRFRECQIWNAIIDSVIEYQLDVDLTNVQVTACQDLYYDADQHYPYTPVQEHQVPPLIADYSINAINGDFNAPSTVHFYDRSIGLNIQSWEWHFDDASAGNGNYSQLQNPTHTFHNPGVFNVLLRITDAENHAATITKQIVISGDSNYGYNYPSGSSYQSYQP